MTCWMSRSMRLLRDAIEYGRHSSCNLWIAAPMPGSQPSQTGMMGKCGMSTIALPGTITQRFALTWRLLHGAKAESVDQPEEAPLDDPAQRADHLQHGAAGGVPQAHRVDPTQRCVGSGGGRSLDRGEESVLPAAGPSWRRAVTITIDVQAAFENDPPALDFVWPGFLAGTVGALV